MRILLISSSSPHPPTRGGPQRANLIYRALSEVAEVDLVLVSADPLESSEELLTSFNLAGQFVWRPAGRRFPFSWLYRFKPLLANRAALAIMPKFLEYKPDPDVAVPVRRLIAEGGYDLIVARLLRPAMKSGCMGFLPTILDLDDVDSHIYRNRLNNPLMKRWERWINRWSFFQVNRLQTRKLRQFDSVWLAHDQHTDLDYLENAFVLPNIPFTAANDNSGRAARAAVEPAPGEPSVILFVGTFDHGPNEAAVDHFLQNIWPSVRQAEPDAIFRIVGSRMGEERRARWAAVPGVDAVGFVENLTNTYASCRFTVAPIFAGSGTNIKVLESLAHGRTTVISRFAHQPFAGLLNDNDSLRVAASDLEFATACIELLRDTSKRASLAAAGREAVELHFSYERFRTIVADTVKQAMRDYQSGPADGEALFAVSASAS